MTTLPTIVRSTNGVYTKVFSPSGVELGIGTASVANNLGIPDERSTGDRGLSDAERLAGVT